MITTAEIRVVNVCHFVSCERVITLKDIFVRVQDSQGGMVSAFLASDEKGNDSNRSKQDGVRFIGLLEYKTVHKHKKRYVIPTPENISL